MSQHNKEIVVQLTELNRYPKFQEVIRREDDNISYPLGLGSLLKPTINAIDHLQASRKKTLPHLQFVVEAPDGSDDSDSWDGSYDSLAHQVDVKLLPYPNDDKEMPAIAPMLTKTIETHKEELFCMLPGWAQTFYKDKHTSLFVAAIMDWISGADYTDAWHHGVARIHPLMEQTLGPWLEKNLVPTNRFVWYVRSIVAHELQHGEFFKRLIDTKIFSGEDEIGSINDTLLTIDKQAVFLPGRHSRYFDELKNNCPTPFIPQRIYVKEIPYLFRLLKLSKSDQEKYIAFAVATGCDELISTIITRTIQLNAKRLDIDFHLESLFGGYSPLLHIYPDDCWIEDWEQQLTCQYEDIGSRLGDFYDDLFERGKLEYIIKQLTQKILKE